MSALGKKDVETRANLDAIHEMYPKEPTVASGLKRMFSEGKTIDQVLESVQFYGGNLNMYAVSHFRHREGLTRTAVVVKPNRKKKSEKKMCTACHRKEVYPGNYFLCRDCQREAPAGEMIYTVGTLARHDSRF